MRTIAAALLRQSGYTVIEAANGEQALAIFGNHLPAVELLVTDVVMPRMGGSVLVDRLRSLKPELKVLFVSGYEDSGESAAERMDPRAAVLNKPFSAQQLTQKVREALDATGSRGSGAVPQQLHRRQ